MKKIKKYLRTHAFLPAFLGVILLWLALPHMSWWPLAFLAPIPWILLIYERRRPKNLYRWLYAAGFLFWLYEVHFVRYPHAVNYVLLLLLAGYMGIYLPIFVAVSRNLVHRVLPRVFAKFPSCGGVAAQQTGWSGQPFLEMHEPPRPSGTPPREGNHHPVCCAATPPEEGNEFRAWATLFVAPIIYMACDILRGWILTGYLMGSLCHTLYRVPMLIQTADIMGEVGVSGLIIFIAACLGLLVWRKDAKMLIPLGVSVAFMLGYGAERLKPDILKGEPPYAAKIALIQGNIPAVLVVDAELSRKSKALYESLTREAISEAEKPDDQYPDFSSAGVRPLDLIVWPEDMYRYPVVFASPDASCPPGALDENDEPFTEEKFRQRLQEAENFSQENLRSIPDHLGVPLVTGGQAIFFEKDGKDKSLNAAMYARPREEAPDGKIEVYTKMHLVPFGEYVPFLGVLSQIFPGAEKYSPIGTGGGGVVGETPKVFRIAVRPENAPHAKEPVYLNASMSICFETVFGRLIRRQIATLEKEGNTPDFLLNVTNNGWFRDSHETRLHLACGVFRAVENRRALLIAANYGISAVIDENGRILQEAPHGESHVLTAYAQKWSGRRTLYTNYGHFLIWWPIFFFAAGCVPATISRKEPGMERSAIRGSGGTM